MPGIEKTFSALFVAGVLACQLWVIVPPNRPYVDWYWPFTDYPMYSASKAPGEVVREHTLRLAVPTVDEVEVVSVSHKDLGIHSFTYFRVLRIIAAWAQGSTGWEAAAREEMVRLENSIRAALSLDGFDVILLERRFEIGRSGLETPDPPWREVLRWSPTDQGSEPSEP